MTTIPPVYNSYYATSFKVLDSAQLSLLDIIVLSTKRVASRHKKKTGIVATESAVIMVW